MEILNRKMVICDVFLRGGCGTIEFGKGYQLGRFKLTSGKVCGCMANVNDVPQGDEEGGVDGGNVESQQTPTTPSPPTSPPLANPTPSQPPPLQSPSPSVLPPPIGNPYAYPPPELPAGVETSPYQVNAPLPHPSTSPPVTPMWNANVNSKPESGNLQIAALILAVLSLMFSLVTSIAGVIVGTISIVKAKKAGENATMGIVSTVVSSAITAISLLTLMLVLFFTAVLFRDSERIARAVEEVAEQSSEFYRENGTYEGFEPDVPNKSDVVVEVVRDGEDRLCIQGETFVIVYHTQVWQGQPLLVSGSRNETLTPTWDSDHTFLVGSCPSVDSDSSFNVNTAQRW